VNSATGTQAPQRAQYLYVYGLQLANTAQKAVVSYLRKFYALPRTSASNRALHPASIETDARRVRHHRFQAVPEIGLQSPADLVDASTQIVPSCGKEIE